MTYGNAYRNITERNYSRDREWQTARKDGARVELDHYVNLDKAIGQLTHTDLMREFRRHRFFVGPAESRRMKAIRARRRAKKNRGRRARERNAY